MRSFIIGVVLLTWAVPAHARQGLTETQIKQIDSLAQRHMRASRMPGLAIAVGFGGALVWENGYGSADIEHNVPATAQTLYRTASISKWMTATAAMRLVEDDKLDLGAPVQQYCRRFSEKRWTLTARHLLTHTGGVRHYWGNNDEPQDTDEERARLRERRDEERQGFTVRHRNAISPVSVFKDDSLLHEPGSRFKYSSHGYRLLGCVLRGAAGKAYAEVMQEFVFDPAGMQHTVNDDHFELILNRASGYMPARDSTVANAPYRDVSENLAAGGHLSTAGDLVRFAMAWNAGRLVSDASRAQMTSRPHFPNADPDGFPTDRHYGFGVNVSSRGGETVLLHSGGQSGTSTLLVLVPDQRVAVAAMTNLQGTELTDLVWGIVDIVDRR